MFSHFGKVKSGIKWCKIKEEEGESPLAKLLNNIMTGDRQFWMAVEKPIPSYAVIDGRKVKIFHGGQRRTCARCQKNADHCLGHSNARLCEDNGGIKVSVEETWKNILKDVDYKEWVGGEIDELNVENKKDEETQERDELEETADASNVDGMVLSNLDEDCTVQDIKNILKGSMNEADLEKITVHPAGSTRSKLIKDIKQNIGSLARRIEGKSFGGRLIHCRPHVPISPVKPSEINVEKQKPMDSPKVDKSVKPKTNKVNTSGIPGLRLSC